MAHDSINVRAGELHHRMRRRERGLHLDGHRRAPAERDHQADAAGDQAGPPAVVDPPIGIDTVTGAADMERAPA